MRKVYRCHNCNKETSVYDGIAQANSPLLNCPYCHHQSDNTLIEGWANTSWRNFDEDIERSIIDGSFQDVFGE